MKLSKNNRKIIYGIISLFSLLILFSAQIENNIYLSFLGIWLLLLPQFITHMEVKMKK